MLLPFSLATSVASEWESASIISMLVIGFCCLVAFFLHERFFAKKSFLPFHLLTDRTVIGSCLTAASLFVSFYCWDIYFTSFLQVVYDLSISDAGYVSQIYNIGSCFWSIVVGLLIPATGRFKWLAICAVPLQILGTGLMIYFRQPDKALGYVIMCQVFINLDKYAARRAGKISARQPPESSQLNIRGPGDSAELSSWESGSRCNHPRVWRNTEVYVHCCHRRTDCNVSRGVFVERHSSEGFPQTERSEDYLEERQILHCGYLQRSMNSTPSRKDGAVSRNSHLSIQGRVQFIIRHHGSLGSDCLVWRPCSMIALLPI